MIFVNGRLIRDYTMGVSRYTNELVNRFSDKAHLIKPEGLAKKGKGLLWEQLLLPRKIRENDLLWSPANTGPILVENQVITIHDLIPYDHPEWYSQAYSIYYKNLSPRITKVVKKIITDSNYSKKRIIDQFNVPKSKVVVIPLGVGEEFLPVAEHKIEDVLIKYGVTSPFFFVLGTIEPRKNLGRLFKAWEIIRLKYPQYKLVVAGIGIAPSAKIKNLTFPRGVKNIGYVDNQDLPALYSGANAFIFPSIYEGFGLPLLEAMACGTPVIASNVTSIPEVVGEAGVLFDPFDINDIASSIEKILHDGELREDLREKGFKQARKFSWDTTAEKVWAVLSQTITEINS